MFPVNTICGTKDVGKFGAIRKFDTHTGIDLYCAPGAPVYAIKSGIVTDIPQFTGTAVDTPWWNDTHAVIISDETLTYVYGELSPVVTVGTTVNEGDLLGHVIPVLKKDKGITPTSMLHFELWEKGKYFKNAVWLSADKPIGLLDPKQVFEYWAIKTPSGYRIETYNGKYVKYFSSSIDCKSYCMFRRDFHNETYHHIGPNSSNEVHMAYHSAKAVTQLQTTLI